MTVAEQFDHIDQVFNDRRSPPTGPIRRADLGVRQRYIRGALMTAILAWLIAFSYLIFTPVRYACRWAFILPGAAHNATLQLETVGQATSTATSPFSSVSLSPKVVYKEIADSDQVRGAAARKIGLTFKEFDRPRIKLVDETGLMHFEMTAPTPELAYKKAIALTEALNEQLDRLRQDELDKRAAAITLNLKSYKDAVETARKRIADIQAKSGLVSINQFNETVANLAATSRKLTELIGEHGKLRDEQAKLMDRVGFDGANAGLALRFSSDPALAQLVTEFSEAYGKYEADRHRLGSENPTLLNLAKRRDSAFAQLKRRAVELGLPKAVDARTVVLIGNLSKQAELLQQLVRNEALIEGKENEISTLTVEKARLEAEIKRLSSAAAQLEDLKKEHLLAEAVYSSALARVDTAKSDIYGAYPILQTLAEPSVPEGWVQPRRLYALAGGTAGMIFSAIAWGLAWLHYVQTAKRRRKRLSSTG